MSYMDQRVSSSTHPSSKREYGNDSEGSDEYDRIYPPHKRSRESPQVEFGMNPNVTKVLFPIPENCVGLVIGRNGTEIQAISSKSACRVQVATEKSATGYRLVDIEGTPENIDRAKFMINEVVARGNLRPPPVLLQNPTQPQISGHNQPKVSIDIPIPAKKCGAIIGKGGETMRKLRAWSNCHIQLIQDSNIVTDAPKPLRIVGCPEAVESARKYVADILSNADDSPSAMVGNGPVSTVSVQVKVPRTTVGAIMGLQGKNIRRLSDETGTKIQFMQDDDAKLVERTLVIIGHQHKVYMAAQLIKEIVEANNTTGNVPIALFYLSIPAAKCGLVIGRGGETIKQINAESGAHCELSRDPTVHVQEKVFVIRGTEVQVEHAKHLICQRVGDIPSTTPFNPFSYKSGQSQPSMPSVFDGQPIIQGQPPQHAQHQQQISQFAQYSSKPDPSQHGMSSQWDGPPVIQGQQSQMMAHIQQQQQQAAYQQSGAVDWQQIQAQRAQQLGQFAANPAASPVVQQLYQQQLQHQQAQLQQQQLQQQQLQHQQQLAAQQQALQQQQLQQQLQQVPAPVPASQPSTYAQKFAPQAAKQVQQQQEAPQQPPAQAAAVQQTAAQQTAEAEGQPSEPKEGEPDFSAQWLEYYISIGDKAAAEGVRARIAKIQEEKAQKEADARAASDSLEARLAAAQELEKERRLAMQMSQQKRPQDGYY